MKTATGEDMAGIPAPAPGSAEGTEDINQQSAIPPASHTPGSAEGEDDPELLEEGDPTKTGESSS